MAINKQSKSKKRSKPKGMTVPLDGAIVVEGYAIVYKGSGVGRYLITIDTNHIAEKDK